MVSRKRATPSAESTGILASADPLILVFEAFVSSDECTELLAMSKAVRAKDDGTCELVGDWTEKQQQLIITYWKKDAKKTVKHYVLQKKRAESTAMEQDVCPKQK